VIPAYPEEVMMENGRGAARRLLAVFAHPDGHQKP
jgi:hypothetical protein